MYTRHVNLSAFVPGPQRGVWQGTTVSSSERCSGADAGSGSPLHGPDGVSPNTEWDMKSICMICTATFSAIELFSGVSSGCELSGTTYLHCRK